MDELVCLLPGKEIVNFVAGDKEIIDAFIKECAARPDLFPPARRFPGNPDQITSDEW